ncbi:MAG TPA: amidohydrolase [Salinimicrobium sp.]|nr:amidohydrolase [Salinimicrobium sp.]
MAEKLKIAILQADLVWENSEANRNQFRPKIEQLSSDVDLIILPEMFSTGFSMNAENLAEPVDGPTLNWMKKNSAENDVAITGSVIIKEEGKYYNRLFFVTPDGNIQKYDKRHTFTLAGENEVYASGQERLIVNYKGWKICPLVCYDLRFPVWARNTEDYDILIFVANWPAVRVVAWDTLLKARAIENLSYCIGVNRVGKDGNGHPYPGHSAVYDCLGKIISDDSNWEREFQQEIILDKSTLEENRKKLKFLQDRDKFSLK